MNRFSFTIGLSLVFVALSPAFADEQPKLIPLDKIWGYNLPGTQDIAGIPFPDRPQGVGQTLAFLGREREYNIEQIRLALAMKPPGKVAAAGFVVPSKMDSRTLSGVLSTLRGKPNPFQQLAESEFTLVFFSHPLSYYNRLRKVERDGNQITVHYQFEPHTTPEATVHFALIPLGKLTAGKYSVSYKQIPLDKKYREMGFEPVHPDAAEIVCRDFSFEVAGPEKADQRGASIPLREIWGYENMRQTKNAEQLDEAHSLIESLTRTIAKRRDTGPIFAVEGTGKTALENMVAAFNDPPRYLPAEKDFSLVFYTRFGPHYVQLDSVERIDNTIVITYHFVTHQTTNATFHFALIPLRLPEGMYKVEVKQASAVNEASEKTGTDREQGGIVCHDATLEVKGKP